MAAMREIDVNCPYVLARLPSQVVWQSDIIHLRHFGVSPVTLRRVMILAQLAACVLELHSSHLALTFPGVPQLDLHMALAAGVHARSERAQLLARDVMFFLEANVT
jgi:hypothetical protein